MYIVQLNNPMLETVCILLIISRYWIVATVYTDYITSTHQTWEELFEPLVLVHSEEY